MFFLYITHHIPQTPYANSQAFRCIRDAYKKQLENEAKGKDTSSSRKREKSGGGTTNVTA